MFGLLLGSGRVSTHKFECACKCMGMLYRFHVAQSMHATSLFVSRTCRKTCLCSLLKKDVDGLPDMSYVSRGHEASRMRFPICFVASMLELFSTRQDCELRL